MDKDSITLKILKSSSVQRQAAEKIENRVENAKAALLQEFENHEVTQEIQSGPDLEKSAVLPEGYGNLFSFLGFVMGSDPISPLRQELEKIHMIKKPIVLKKNWKFRIITPSEEEIYKVTPMNWESGRSWVHAITYGLSGFSHYMFSLTNGRFPKSRSGTGIQAKNNIRSGSEYVSGISYVIGMLGRFKRKIIR